VQLGDIEHVLQDDFIPFVSSAHADMYTSLADALDGAVITQDYGDVSGKGGVLLEPISVGTHGP
jgi:hypothetical protein